MAQDVMRAIDFDLGSKGQDLRTLRCERADAISALRRICERHGDNDWTDDLNLADIIEKHLGRHLGE